MRSDRNYQLCKSRKVWYERFPIKNENCFEKEGSDVSNVSSELISIHELCSKEEDLDFLDGLFDYLKFNNAGLVDDVDEDREELEEPEMNIDDESWDTEDLMNSNCKSNN